MRPFNLLLTLTVLVLASLPTELIADFPIRIVSQNMNRLFDDKDDGNQEKVVSTALYRKRLNTLTEAIADKFEFAHVIAIQEIESLDVLNDIAHLLRSRHHVEYRALLIEGNDQSGIDTGFLIHNSLNIKSVQALFSNSRLDGGAPLFSRPPLLAEVCRQECLTLINVHLRSMRGLGSTKKGKKVAHKRRQQAETIARWLNRRQNTRPDEKIILLGDFNALSPSDEHVDVIGTILGAPDRKRPRWTSQDLVQRDLDDITARIPVDERVSFVYRKRPQQLDYMLVSAPLKPSVLSVRFTPIEYHLSDHAALIVEIALP